MERKCGYQKMQFRKIHRTQILPLRWFANLCEKPAHYHLGEALHYDDHDDHGFVYKYHAYMSNLFYKPYLKWGTVYKLDLDGMVESLKNDPVLDELGSDYDENGIPYWEK
jgi:hypothetical protein